MFKLQSLRECRNLGKLLINKSNFTTFKMLMDNRIREPNTIENIEDRTQNAKQEMADVNFTDSKDGSRECTKLPYLNVKFVKSDELDVILRSTDETEKVKEVLNSCCQLGHLTQTQLFSILDFFAESGYMEGIKHMESIYKEIDPDFVKLNSNFAHYNAKALWVKGNSSKAIDLLEEIYTNNPLLRRQVSYMLRSLLQHPVNGLSGATLMKAISLGKKFLAEYRDHYLMTSIFRVCLFSDWISDQNIALELFECHQVLRQWLAKNSIHNCYFVKKWRSEQVRKLFALLHKYNMESECLNIFDVFLKYRIRNQDLVECLEILQVSSNYNIKMSDEYYEKLLNVLVNYGSMRKSEE